MTVEGAPHAYTDLRFPLYGLPSQLNHVLAGRDYRVCDLAEPQFNREQCLEDYPNTYALTFWSHTWGR